MNRITFRIHTEDKPTLEALVASRFQAFAIFRGVGFWKGQRENAVIIEIIGTGIDRSDVVVLARDIREANAQEAVYVTETPVHLHDIRA